MTDQLPILANVTIAMFLGGLIGLEREVADKPAGLRTHMLVAASAALLVGLGGALVGSFQTREGAGPAADPMRIVQAIVIGIGFLGAGTIIQRGPSERVQGLTTGATLLLAASVGICTAARQFVLAAGVTAIALAVLVVLGHTEKWLARKRQAKAQRDAG